MKTTGWLVVAGALAIGSVQAATEVTIHRVTEEGIGKAHGTISISETEYGLLFTPDLTDLPLQGIQGFHVHENGSCAPGTDDGETVAGLAAGGHFDPQDTDEHLGPYGEGHLGDLPALYVKEGGRADYPVLAPRIRSVEQISGRALMIHEGGDNHSDHPEELGGGGARILCGVIP